MQGGRPIQRTGHTLDIAPVLTGIDSEATEWFFAALGWSEPHGLGRPGRRDGQRPLGGDALPPWPAAAARGRTPGQSGDLALLRGPRTRALRPAHRRDWCAGGSRLRSMPARRRSLPLPPSSTCSWVCARWPTGSARTKPTSRSVTSRTTATSALPGRTPGGPFRKSAWTWDSNAAPSASAERCRASRACSAWATRRPPTPSSGMRPRLRRSASSWP